jgi:hypothetical protein
VCRNQGRQYHFFVVVVSGDTFTVLGTEHRGLGTRPSGFEKSLIFANPPPHIAICTAVAIDDRFIKHSINEYVLPIYLSTYLPTYLPTYLSTYLLTYLPEATY